MGPGRSAVALRGSSTAAMSQSRELVTRCRERVTLSRAPRRSRRAMQTSLRGCDGEMDLSTSGLLGGRTRSKATGPRQCSDRTLTLFLPIFKTLYHVVVHHAGRLHVRVADGRADEREAAFLQILGQGIGLRRCCLHGFLGDALGMSQCSIAREAPDVPVEAAELFLHFQETFCVGDSALDFQTIADDARVVHQTCDVGFAESRDLACVEVFERLPEILALAQDRNPAQSRLKAF